MDRPVLVLIDGHALAYRQFFALPVETFSTRSGEPTNAVYGFARTLIDILNEHPVYLAVAFDKGMSGRDELFEEYKGTREKMPDEMRTQMARIRELIQAFNIPILELDGYEADDVLGSIAPQAEGEGCSVRIITGDRDLLQLITDCTTVQLPGKRQGDAQIYDVDRFHEEYDGLEPLQLVDLKGLMGDNSDNIPGVKGIGQKGAQKLIKAYGSVANLYDHLDEIKGSTHDKLEASRDLAFLSRELARIRTDVPVTIALPSCVAHDYSYAQVEALFRELEFRTLIDHLPGAPQRTEASGPVQQLSMFEVAETPQAEAAPEEGPVPFAIVDDDEKLAVLVARLNAAEAITFDVETTSIDRMLGDLVGISLSVDGGEGYYLPVGHIPTNAPHSTEVTQPDLVEGHTPRQIPLKQVMDAIRPAMTNPDIPKYAHNASYDLVMMRRYGIDVQPITFDTMVAEWVCDPTSRNLGLKNLAWVRTGVRMTEISDLIGTGKNQITMDRVPVERAAPYAAADAVLTHRLAALLKPELEERNAWKLFSQIEMPLIPVIADMEMNGVLLDVDYLHALSKDLGDRLVTIAEEIYDLSGGPFNIGSPKQLNDILFEKLGLPTEGLRKTTHGLSTAADVLDSLRDAHPIVERILAWRELSKLQSTYVDALPALINPRTGRVHTHFNQTGTATGRVSSIDPNLQNIPVRTEEGRRVRHAFITPDGCSMLSVDYSQVELRILAHYSQDDALLEAFRNGVDIHRATAAAVYNVPLDAVTYEQRSFAKSVNFGLMYGMGAFRLARDSALTLAEAEDFITNYFHQFPGVRTYLDGSLEQARQRGYVETLLGRRRYFRILEDKGDKPSRTPAYQRAEREAINMPVQGTAADIIKIAMINLARALKDGGFQSRMILQVHDELVLEGPDEEMTRIAPLVIEVMESAFTLDAPLRADARIGPNWAELVPYEPEAS